MLDTVGAEMQVVNKSEKSISLQVDSRVVLTPDKGQEASSQILPINFDGLAKVHSHFQPPLSTFHVTDFLACTILKRNINLNDLGFRC